MTQAWSQLNGVWQLYILYLKKGLLSDPDNYRGITSLSCTSKLFTSCLSCNVEENILGQVQAGLEKAIVLLIMYLFYMLLLNYTNLFISGFLVPLLIIGKPLIQSIEVSFGKNYYHMESMGKCLCYQIYIYMIRLNLV